MKYDLTTKLLKKSKGRHDDLKQAFDAGNLHQPGLMQALAASVADGDVEMAQYVTETVLPAYGQAVVPLLVSAFDPNGKKVDARRLEAVRRIDPATALQLARTALNAKHVDLIIEVIQSLKGSVADSMSIFTLAQRRNDRIQREAYTALSGVTEPAVVEAVVERFRKEAPWVSLAIQFTPHSTYTTYCVSTLQSLGAAADTAGCLTEKQMVLLNCVFHASQGHCGSELDEALSAWVDRASKGFFDQTPQPFSRRWDKRELAAAVATSTTPRAQRLLVAARACFDISEMSAVMGAAAWHEDFDLVELFSPYLAPSKTPGRCHGWFCGCGGGWSCSLYSAVEFALKVDFESANYKGRKPHPLHLPVIQRVRNDPRWKAAMTA